MKCEEERLFSRRGAENWVNNVTVWVTIKYPGVILNRQIRTINTTFSWAPFDLILSQTRLMNEVMGITSKFQVHKVFFQAWRWNNILFSNIPANELSRYVSPNCLFTILWLFQKLFFLCLQSDIGLTRCKLHSGFSLRVLQDFTSFQV